MDFREIVSGRSRGLGASLLRCGLALGEIPYTAVVRRRNARYDQPGPHITRVARPVISVGNLTLGGTGKTPMVEWLARWFIGRGLQVALVSRGYGSRSGPNDEALELAQKLPATPHWQNPDRVAAARQAIEAGAELILLDDGFQHRRLARDLDIVLVDALEPFGFGHVFPRGTLREPLGGWSRAQVIALSRADLVTPAERDRIRREVERHAPQACWAEVSHAPRGLLAVNGEVQPTESLRGKRVAAFCGIGNPAGFRAALAGLGCQIAAFREFPDHHAYSTADVQSLDAWAAAAGVDLTVCTHKDLVKLTQLQLGAQPLWALTIGLEFLSGLEAIEALLAPFSSSLHTDMRQGPG